MVSRIMDYTIVHIENRDSFSWIKLRVCLDFGFRNDMETHEKLNSKYLIKQEFVTNVYSFILIFPTQIKKKEKKEAKYSGPRSNQKHKKLSLFYKSCLNWKSIQLLPPWSP